MGLIANQSRMLELTARQNDLEFQQQEISQQRIMVATQEGNIATAETQAMAQYSTGTSTTDETEMTITSNSYNAQLVPIESLDKTLELQSQRLDTQHQAITTEIDATEKNA
jgi:hypothetical protein